MVMDPGSPAAHGAAVGRRCVGRHARGAGATTGAATGRGRRSSLHRPRRRAAATAPGTTLTGRAAKPPPPPPLNPEPPPPPPPPPSPPLPPLPDEPATAKKPPLPPTPPCPPSPPTLVAKKPVPAPPSPFALMPPSPPARVPVRNDGATTGAATTTGDDRVRVVGVDGRASATGAAPAEGTANVSVAAATAFTDEQVQSLAWRGDEGGRDGCATAARDTGGGAPHHRRTRRRAPNRSRPAPRTWLHQEC